MITQLPLDTGAVGPAHVHLDPYAEWVRLGGFDIDLEHLRVRKTVYGNIPDTDMCPWVGVRMI